MEVGGAVVALDHGEGAARPHDALQRLQRRDRRGQVLQHEAHEHVIEGPIRKRQREQVGALERDVGHAGGLRGGRGRGERRLRDVDRGDDRAGTVAGQRHRLRAHAAAGLEHAAAVRVAGVVVQQLDQRGRLVEQSLALAGVVAVDVGSGHAIMLSECRDSRAIVHGADRQRHYVSLQ